ncbi:MAG TPA: hypothetical protein VHC19_10985 [Pirellulales bacterium]|jgi:hypothetical protein|nr:hypothetical protein [Pirellulales bacterium]
MNVRANLGLAFGVLAAWAVMSSAAHAQNPNYLYLFGMGRGLPYSYDEHVPYYSLYPPVYYSAPVPRTYGYSPFAYPPGYMTPEIEVQPAPQIMNNPYVVPGSAKPAKPESAESEDRTAQAPQVILNPFVEQRFSAESELAARETPQR